MENKYSLKEIDNFIKRIKETLILNSYTPEEKTFKYNIDFLKITIELDDSGYNLKIKRNRKVISNRTILFKEEISLFMGLNIIKLYYLQK